MNSNIKNEKMNLQLALDELEISLDDIELTNLNKEYIKKQYRKQALKWHPDKNDDIIAKEKFQTIHEAYDFLLNELCIINEEEELNTFEPFVSSNNYKDPKMYINILGGFISSLFNKETYNEIIINIIKDISLGCEAITLTYLQKLFQELDKQIVIEIYQLIYRYKDILYINSETLEFVSLIIKEKVERSKEKDRVFILKPLLKDLLEHNIYKLYVDDELYLVPLWHNELYFDAKDGSEIIVLCQPKFPERITIDENNNIYFETNVKLDINLIQNSKFVSVEIGEKWFSIPLDKLYLKEEQLYRLKKQGISKIVENDMYNVTNRSDIIVKIIFN
jgi:hypothetical protein